MPTMKEAGLQQYVPAHSERRVRGVKRMALGRRTSLNRGQLSPERLRKQAAPLASPQGPPASADTYKPSELIARRRVST